MWEVSWRLNKDCNILTPSSSGHSSASFSFSWAAQPGAWFSFQHLLSNWSELPVAPGYIIICRPPTSCERHICIQFNPSTVKVIPPDIFDRMHLLFTQMHFFSSFFSFFDSSAGGQYVTMCEIWTNVTKRWKYKKEVSKIYLLKRNDLKERKVIEKVTIKKGTPTK